MRRVAGRLAAASGSRPAGIFWPGTLPHPDLGRAPCCVEAGCLAGNKRRGGRERDARGGYWGSREDLRAARRRRPEPVRGCACSAAAAGGTRRECVCCAAAAAETWSGGACGAAAAGEMCVLPLKSNSIWIILFFFIQ